MNFIAVIYIALSGGCSNGAEQASEVKSPDIKHKLKKMNSVPDVKPSIKVSTSLIKRKFCRNLE